MKRPPPRDFFVCPHCGAELPVNAHFCRECGADEEFGWNEDFGEDDDLPDGGYDGDGSFDYDEYIAREFPDQAPRPTARRLMLRTVTIVVILAFLLWFLAMCHG